jgi:hypothetical protein
MLSAVAVPNAKVLENHNGGLTIVWSAMWNAGGALHVMGVTWGRCQGVDFMPKASRTCARFEGI